MMSSDKNHEKYPCIRLHRRRWLSNHERLTDAYTASGCPTINQHESETRDSELLKKFNMIRLKAVVEASISPF